MESSLRMIRKRFKCIYCNIKIGKLVEPSMNFIKCDICGKEMVEISEDEFSQKTRSDINQNYRFTYNTQNNPNRKNNQNENYTNNTRSSTNNFSSNRTNKRIENNRNTQNFNNINNNINNTRNMRGNNNDRNNQANFELNNNNSRRRSTNYRTNANNININHQSSNNVNFFGNFGNLGDDLFNHNFFNQNSNTNNIQNSYNQPNIDFRNSRSNGRINENFFRNNIPNNLNTGRNQQNSRFNTRRRNQDGRIEIEEDYNFFRNFFSGFGVDFEFPFERSPFTGRVDHHNFNSDVFDPEFEMFGSTYNNFFQDNFASNFRSNFGRNRDRYADLIELILQNNSAQQNPKPPTSKKALKSLKRFKMSEKYCKKNEKKEIEFPNCCICITDINIGEITLMLPCGHVFHDNCVVSWLKKNNTCPVCRFELPPEEN